MIKSRSQENTQNTSPAVRKLSPQQGVNYMARLTPIKVDLLYSGATLRYNNRYTLSSPGKGLKGLEKLQNVPND